MSNDFESNGFSPVSYALGGVLAAEDGGLSNLKE